MASATIASQQENDSASGSDSKKRNKLGYHRTAVACGHCRRRKIRCIPSSDPSETKCANCIRLKKECQFYPVDQNGSNTRKHRSDSRVEPSADATSLSRTSVSPGHPPSSTSDSFQTSFRGTTASSIAWVDTSGLVTSPSGRIRPVHTIEQQEWSHSSPQKKVPIQFSQPDSHTAVAAGTYWMQDEDNTAISYQQPYMAAVSSANFPQESQLAYQNAFHDTRHSVGRQSFNGIPTSEVDQTLDSYRHYNSTFSEIERGITMPSNLFNHAVTQAGPQLMAGPGQIMYDHGYSQQMTNHTQTWMTPLIPQSTFSSQYLPTHQERRYSQYTS